MLERTVVYVDTSYLLASFYNSWEIGARAQLEIDLPEVVAILDGMISNQLGQRVHRQNWYDGIPDTGPHRYQRALRTCEGVQLRTGQLIEWGERRTQKAVDTRLVADMVTTACKQQFTDMVLVSGDADMIPGVQEATNAGIRVHLYGFGWDSMSAALRHACDTTTILDPREDFTGAWNSRCWKVRYHRRYATTTPKNHLCVIQREKNRPHLASATIVPNLLWCTPRKPARLMHLVRASRRMEQSPPKATTKPRKPILRNQPPRRTVRKNPVSQSPANPPGNPTAMNSPRNSTPPPSPVLMRRLLRSRMLHSHQRMSQPLLRQHPGATNRRQISLPLLRPHNLRPLRARRLTTTRTRRKSKPSCAHTAELPATPTGTMLPTTTRTTHLVAHRPAPSLALPRPSPSMMAPRRKLRSRYVPLPEEVWTSAGFQTPFDVGQQYARWWYDNAASPEQRDQAHLLSGGGLPPEVDRPLLQFACETLHEYTLSETQRVKLRDGFHSGIRGILLNASRDS